MKRVSRSPLATEHEEQVALFQWAALSQGRYPELALLFAIANSGAGAQAGRAGWLKAEGVKPGVPDVCLPVARGGYHGLYIELKRRKGGEVSPDQTRWHVALRVQGYQVEVCEGAERAIALLTAYLGSVS